MCMHAWAGCEYRCPQRLEALAPQEMEYRQFRELPSVGMRTKPRSSALDC